MRLWQYQHNDNDFSSRPTFEMIAVAALDFDVDVDAAAFAFFCY